MRASSALAVGIIAAALGGCSPESPAMMEYKEFVADVCACADAACAEAVDKEEQQWRQMSYPNLSQQDRDALKNARQGFTECRDERMKK